MTTALLNLIAAGFMLAQYQPFGPPYRPPSPYYNPGQMMPVPQPPPPRYVPPGFGPGPGTYMPVPMPPRPDYYQEYQRWNRDWRR